MEDTKEIILEKLESAFRDMNAHSYNNYTDDSEYSIIFTVKELRWLYNEINKIQLYEYFAGTNDEIKELLEAVKNFYI